MALQYLLAPTFQFVNTAGKPLSGGAYMEVYVHGTRTKYFCASDFDGTLHPFRIPLDSLGSNIVLANDTGSYDVYAYNRYGTLMMSRYNVRPGAGGGIGGTITSTDGSIDIHPTDDGVDLSVNGLDPSCLKVSADPRTTDGKFHFTTLVKEGDQAYVDNEGAIRLIKGWYHFTANVQLAWTAGARNESHQVTLYTTLSSSVVDFDISHAHTETIELSGDVSIAQDGSELVIGISGIPTGLEARVVGMDVHAITGKDGHDTYYAGPGITISNENYIAADFDEVQEKLAAGEGISITGNVISSTVEAQVQADWTQTDSDAVDYIKNKPNMDQYATQAQLATKQDTISDLAQIRAGAAAGASAVQASDLAVVATTGNYNDLNNRPNLNQYATDQELTAGLATKQDTINDLSSIRSGAAAGSTAVQPADLAAVATSGDYDDLSNKPTIPTKTSDLTNDSGFITSADAPVKDVQVEGVSVVNAQGIAEISIPATGVLDVEVDGTSVVNAQGTAEIDLSGYATTQALTSGLAGKQDTISDLATIRSGAAAGASAVQPGDLATVATTGDYDDLSNKPSIPTVDQTYNASSTNAQSGVAVAQAIASVPGVSYTAGDAIDITNNEISVDYDSNTLELGSQQPVTHTYNVGTYNTGAINMTYGEVPADIRSVLTQETVTVHIPANTFYTYYIGAGQNATLLFKANNNDYPQDVNVAYCPTPLTYTFEQATNKYWLDEQDVTVTTLTGSASARNYFTFGFKGEYVMNDVWTTNGLVNPVVFRYTSAAGTGSLTVKNPLPASSASDANKVLTVDAQGVAGWATPAPGGVTDVEVDGTSVVSGGVASITMPTVDQTYNASSANAQSGVAIAGALATKQDTISDLAAIRSGAAEGATAVQPGDLATVATTGSYDDLSDKPTIPAAQVNSDWNSNSGVSQILNKPTLSTVATTGDYDDLSNKPSIPAAQVNSDWNASSGVSEILNKPDLSVYATTQALNTGLAGKQDTISDLATIRSGAAAGASAVQPGDLATVATSGSYNDLSNTPTILPYKPVVAGTGVRIVDDTANNRIVVEADETVLYSNTSGNDGDITLSESITNFARIKIYFSTTRAYTAGAYYYGGKFAEFDVADLTVTNKLWISDTTGNGSTANTVVMKVQSYDITNGGTILTWKVASQLYYNGSTFAVSANKSFVYKVIGINRISST